MRRLQAGLDWAVLALAGALLGACGGGSGASSSVGAGTTPAVANQVAAIVDAGPLPQQSSAINTLYTSVMLCAPASASACQTIDHVQVDTGSSGFRVLASVLGSGVTAAQLPPTTDANGNAIVECTQFLDGWSWGPVRSADIRIAGEVAHSVPVQVIGDPAYPNGLIPSTCSNVPGGSVEDTVLQFGANGILGVGNFIQDCGPYCAPGTPYTQNGSNYNACTASTPAVCTPATVALASQVSNPVAYFASDSTGVVITLPAVVAAGAQGAAGTLTFGIGTQADNALGGATVFQLDAGFGTLQTTFNGAALNRSVIDSGSNALFFPDAAIPTCTVSTGFYCPSAALSLSGLIQGLNGASRTVAFEVDAADSIPVGITAAPGLAGPAGSAAPSTFDWGLAFFYGRTVFVVLEGATVGGVAGPSVAF